MLQQSTINQNLLFSSLNTHHRERLFALFWSQTLSVIDFENFNDFFLSHTWNVIFILLKRVFDVFCDYINDLLIQSQGKGGGVFRELELMLLVYLLHVDFQI